MLDKISLKFLQGAGQKDSTMLEKSIFQYVEKVHLGEDEYPEFFSDISE